MPRLGTRKLYYLLKDDFQNLGIKSGRDCDGQVFCLKKLDHHKHPQSILYTLEITKLK